VVYGAYTDFIVPRFAAVAILAALEYRRRTGQGQHIDLAQSEARLLGLSAASRRRLVEAGIVY
jgi:benzylsuccinate CoA-transferase BbsF subunit